MYQKTKRKTTHRILCLFLSLCMTISFITVLTVPAGASTIGTSILDTGIAVVDKYVPGGKFITSFFKPFLKKLFDDKQPDPTLEAINKLQETIESRLNEVQKAIQQDIRNGNTDILNEIKNDTYINGFGNNLDDLYQQIETLKTNMATTNASTDLSDNAKAVENAYLIGNNADWGKAGNIVFNLNRLANVLRGQTFTDLGSRDLYQVVYDANVSNAMFSGEAYDASEPYINKVMYVYLYGCAIVSGCMSDARKVSKFTDEEVNALPSVVREHYKEAAVSTGNLIDSQVESLQNIVFDISKENSVMTHYMIFCYKKEHCRNIFIDKGHSTPVAISNNIDSRDFDFRKYSCSAINGEAGNEVLYREMKSYIDGSVKSAIQTALNQDAISLAKTREIQEHVAKRYNISFKDYLKDMCGIDLPDDSSWVLPTAGISDKEDVISKTYRGSGIFDIRFESHKIRIISISGITASGNKDIEMYKYDLDIYGGWVTAQKTNDVSLVIFQKAAMLDIPKTGMGIMEPFYKLNLSIKSKTGSDHPEDFVVGSAPVDINERYNVFITDIDNNAVDITYTWESQKGPREGIKLTPDGMLSITRRDCYRVRVKCTSPNTGKVYYSPWITIISYIAGGGEEPEPVDYPIEYTDADENTNFRIYGSFLGTVNDEPECIEGEPSVLIKSTEEEQVYSKDHFRVETYDANDLHVYVRHTWEAQEQSGISLAPDGTATFTKSGIYHVRVRSGEYTSGWVEINVLSDVYYTVVYDVYGDTNFDIDFVEPDSTVTRPIDPIRNGYTFLYWALDGKEYDFSTPVTGDIVLKAVWALSDGWNLFSDSSEHVYMVNVSGEHEVQNTNKASSKFFDATLSNYVITVKLKDGVDRKKAVNSNLLEFDLGSEGTVSYLMPLIYTKPTFKLSNAKATVKSGVSTDITTKVLVLDKNGSYVPYDLTDATLKYGSNSVTGSADGIVKITVSGKANDKLVISRDGWNEKDPVQLAFTVSAVAKDVLAVDLGGLKQVMLNTNAPEQVLSFPLTFNGAAATSGTVTIVPGKKGEEQLAGISDGMLTISLGRSGLKKGSYTINLTAGNAKIAVKVKVSDKALNSAVTVKIKQKYDMVTRQPMVVTPTLKEVSGAITAVKLVGPEGFDASVDGDNIVIDYTGKTALTSAALGDMTLQLTVDGITTPIEVKMKNVTAQKAAPIVKAAKVTIPKSATMDGTKVIAATNITSTYKDSAKNIHSLVPDSVTLDCKNVEADVDSMDNCVINITKLTGKSGSIKVTLTYGGGVTKTVTVGVSLGK